MPPAPLRAPRPRSASESDRRRTLSRPCRRRARGSATRTTRRASRAPRRRGARPRASRRVSCPSPCPSARPPTPRRTAKRGARARRRVVSCQTSPRTYLSAPAEQRVRQKRSDPRGDRPQVRFRCLRTHPQPVSEREASINTGSKRQTCSRQCD